jgi:DNA-binding XRE family transcriptional regulator
LVSHAAAAVTWAELGRLCGMRRHTFFYWGQGKTLPSLASLYTVARALRVSIHDLIPKR